MKFKKKHMIGSIILVFILLMLILYGTQSKKNNDIFFIKKAILNNEQNINYTIKKIDEETKEIYILIEVVDDLGIKSIEYPDGYTIYANGNTRIGIDYVTTINQSNIFKVINNENDEFEKDVCISNAPPSVPEITAFPQTEDNIVKYGRTVTIVADSTDIDGDEITYIWEGRIAESSNEYEIGTHTVRVKAVDTYGTESDWAEYTFTVIEAEALGGIAVYNETNANFDIRAADGNIKTTYSNGGYTSVIKVGNNQTNMSSAAQTYNNVEFVRTHEVNSVQEYVKTTYTVTNNNDTAQTIAIAVHADIQIGSNDSAPIYANNTGFRMTDGTYAFYMYLKNMQDVDDVDTIWFGPYGSRTSYLWESTTAESCTNTDSGMAFSWKDRIIEPGETKTFSFKLILE